MGKPHFVAEPVIMSSETFLYSFGQSWGELSVPDDHSICMPVCVFLFVHVREFADLCDGALCQLWCLCPVPAGCVGVPRSPVG